MKHLVKLLLLFVVLVLGAVFFKTQQVNSSAQDQQKIWNLSVGFDTDQVEPGVPFDDMPLVKEIRALQREDLGVFLDYRQVLIITDSIISPEGADLSAFSGPSAMKKRGEILYAVGDEVFGINKGSIDELNLTESEQTYTNRLVSIVADIKNGKGDQHFQVEYLASRYAVVQASVNDGLVLFADRSAIQEKYDQYYEDELARLKQEGNGTQQNSERSVLIGTSTITTRSGSCPYEPKERIKQQTFCKFRLVSELV